MHANCSRRCYEGRWPKCELSELLQGNFYKYSLSMGRTTSLRSVTPPSATLRTCVSKYSLFKPHALCMPTVLAAVTKAVGRSASKASCYRGLLINTVCQSPLGTLKVLSYWDSSKSLKKLPCQSQNYEYSGLSGFLMPPSPTALLALLQSRFENYDKHDV